LALGLIGLAACGDDDNNPTNPNNPETKAWHGTWLSAGSDVAPILVSLFQYDSVRVTMNSDNTVMLETHPAGGAWTTLNGVYSVTESSTGDVDAIAINYTAFEQEGIVQVWTATPDSLWLEVVQTVPDIGATPRTPASGFGSDPQLLNFNIQKYRRID
ncbi:MAG TPA: hypothetical protein PLQ13_10505, partial [Candidatus Krumholzibacteria bacterium]|nr:hypothetical protein [Candidatus Krumholzibacteria bacterium]